MNDIIIQLKLREYMWHTVYTNPYSSTITGKFEKLAVVASDAEHSSIVNSSSGRGTSLVEIELVHKMDLDAM